MRLIPALVAFGLLLPLAAQAEDVTTWNFGDPNAVGQWVVQELVTQQAEEGLYVRADTDGFLQVPARFVQPFHVVTLTVTSPATTKASLLWNTKGTTQFAELPFAIPVGQYQTIDIVTSEHREQNPHPVAIGIFLEQGTELMIHDVAVRGWSLSERIGYAAKSFWKVDEYRPYSINFLWGPLIAQNPVSLQYLYEKLPPPSPSATRIFYVILGIALLSVLATWVLRKMQSVDARALGIFFALAAGLWLLFDLRMSVEVLSYVRDDVKAYVLPEPGKRMLRTHLDLYDMLFRILPTLQQENRYALLYPPEGQHYSMYRYFTYPSLPITQEKDLTGITNWVVVDRPDLKVNAEGRIAGSDGVPLSPPGRITLQLNKYGYLFTVNP